MIDLDKMHPTKARIIKETLRPTRKKASEEEIIELIQFLEHIEVTPERLKQNAYDCIAEDGTKDEVLAV